MDVNNEASDELRPEYDLSQLKGGVQGKYRHHRAAASNLWLLCIALLCGAIPLAVGITIYLVWRNNRQSGLEGAGLLNILAGLVLFGIGIVCLVTYNSRESKIDRSRRVPLQLQVSFVLGLLFANFPAAVFCVISATNLMGQYLVRVVNESDTTIDSIMIRGPGVGMELGPLSPKSSTRRFLNFTGDGTLNFSARQSGLQSSGEIEGYVTGSGGGDGTLRVRPNGVFVIEHKHATRQWAD